MMNRDELASLINPHHLQLIILPTEQCNFRCTYCYEDFEIGRMADTTVSAIKKLISRRLHKLKSLEISWFGGEPLIAKDIVMDISAYAQQASQEAEIIFQSDMTTNAYSLTTSTFLSLASYGVRAFQISLDGDEAEHNKTRKLISGKGSFEKIWHNLLSMRDSAEIFKTLLRVHVHADNVASVKRLLSKIDSEFGSDSRFSVVLKAVGNWGGESVKQMSLINPSQDVMSELLSYRKNLPGNSAASTSSNGLLVPHACYAALPSSLVIRADGALAKCTVALNDARNKIGHINDDGSVSIANEAMHSFMRGFETANSSELKCPMKNMPQKTIVQTVHFHKNFPAL